MGKRLIINGADFSANGIKTANIKESIYISSTGQDSYINLFPDEYLSQTPIDFLPMKKEITFTPIATQYNRGNKVCGLNGWCGCSHFITSSNQLVIEVDVLNHRYYWNVLQEEYFKKHTVTIQNDIATLDGNTDYDGDYASSGFQEQMEFSYFFGIGVPIITSKTSFSSAQSDPNTNKIHNIKITDANGNIIRDVYPALDESDRPCMYDIVNEMYYYNNVSSIGDDGFIVE